MAKARPLHHPAAPDGPPPRSGEDLGRRKHRTVGAPDKTVKLARKLRKEMSLPEVLLWQQLRQRPGGFKFRKQCPQEWFVLDFACMEARLCIEVDGEAHDRGDRPERDERRDRRLLALGFETMRIPAREVLGNMEGVLAAIVARCQAFRPLHHPAAPDGPPPRSGEDLEGLW
jgi:very-short-patch-repair endonuclease